MNDAGKFYMVASSVKRIQIKRFTHILLCEMGCIHKVNKEPINDCESTLQVLYGDRDLIG